VVATARDVEMLYSHGQGLPQVPSRRGGPRGREGRGGGLYTYHQARDDLFRCLGDYPSLREMERRKREGGRVGGRRRVAGGNGKGGREEEEEEGEETSEGEQEGQSNNNAAAAVTVKCGGRPPPSSSSSKKRRKGESGRYGQGAGKALPLSAPHTGPTSGGGEGGRTKRKDGESVLLSAAERYAEWKSQVVMEEEEEEGEEKGEGGRERKRRRSAEEGTGMHSSDCSSLSSSSSSSEEEEEEEEEDDEVEKRKPCSITRSRRRNRRSLPPSHHCSSSLSFASSPSPPPPLPLVLLSQPPPTFAIGLNHSSSSDPSLPPSLPSYFTFRVGLPRCCRRAVKRLQTSCSLVVELRYAGKEGGREGGEGGIEQSYLTLLEDPVLRPGEREWLVKARITALSRQHTRRAFSLWVDVSAFEQREHGLCVSGVQTSAVRTVKVGKGGGGKESGGKEGAKAGREGMPLKRRSIVLTRGQVKDKKAG